MSNSITSQKPDICENPIERKRPDQGIDYVLHLSCQDKPGIVASVAGTIAECNGNIIESSQYGDPETGRFFMRVKFSSPLECDKNHLLKCFTEIAEKYTMQWQLYDAMKKCNTILMASKTDHCLNDLLYRTEMGTLPINIKRIISNHEHIEEIANNHSIPFTHLPITKETKAEQEQKLRAIIKDEEAELIVLARYMQILSENMAGDHAGKIINIHHSFLPGFKGAKPYHRAYERGVKLIGATAHYVTSDLDEGPIIEQEVERVNHTMSVKDLIAAGRDIERRVLSRAVKYHAEHRVLINNGKTVVFN